MGDFEARSRKVDGRNLLAEGVWDELNPRLRVSEKREAEEEDRPSPGTLVVEKKELWMREGIENVRKSG